MAKIFTTEYELTALADAIRERGGTSEPLAFPSGYVQAINNIEKRCVNPNLFQKTMDLTIETCSISDLTRVPKNIFRQCALLSHVSFPACVEIGSYAFEYAIGLKEAFFPECVTIEESAFFGCEALLTASFPKCELIGNFAFTSCSSLTSVSFPCCKVVADFAFRSCPCLSVISLPACSIIATSAFVGCSSLKSIYLMLSSVVALADSAVFNSTPIAESPDGSIYVPGSLIETYKSAFPWSYFSSKIIAGD